MPTWTYTIRLADVFHNEDMTFGQRRDAIVKRIRASRWYREAGEDSELAMYVEELGDATYASEFDSAWNEIYNLADADQAWIETV